MSDSCIVLTQLAPCVHQGGQQKTSGLALGGEKTLHTMGISSCVSSERLLADKQAGGGLFTFSLCAVFFFPFLNAHLFGRDGIRKRNKTPASPSPQKNLKILTELYKLNRPHLSQWRSVQMHTECLLSLILRAARQTWRSFKNCQSTPAKLGPLSYPHRRPAQASGTNSARARVARRHTAAAAGWRVLMHWWSDAASCLSGWDCLTCCNIYFIFDIVSFAVSV